jgi:hypothetical protein
LGDIQNAGLPVLDEAVKRCLVFRMTVYW